ncbi:MAG: hypothetical protein SVR94_16445 [Pseudomonadota bacterium]|nr:hypothetical protein [Pseudomonadota bacterium]
MFELLSSDITKALYPEIGLEVSNQETLIQHIRESLLRYYALPDPEKFNEKADKKFAQITLTTMSEKISKEVAWCLCQWGIRIFKYILSDRTPYGYWSALFLYCWDNDDLWHALKLPQHNSETFKQKFLMTKDNSVFRSLYEQASQQKCSDWDLYLLNKSIEEGEADDYTFLDSLELTLEATAEIVKSQHFWYWVIQTFTEQEINNLHHNAEILAKQIEELNFIEQLTHPSLLISHIRERTCSKLE